MAKFFALLSSLSVLNWLTITLTTVHGANILAVLPSVWKSHYLFGRCLLQQLVAQQQNHSVTIISPHALVVGDDGDSSAELPNIREIRIDGLMENWIEMGMSFDVEQMHAKSVMERFTRLIYAGTTNVDLLLSDAKVRKLLTSGERFDLLLVDLFLSDALLGLAYYYGIPTVVISPTGANSWLNHMLGNPQSSALDPSNFLPFSERMQLWERSINTLMCLFEKLTYNFLHMIAQQTVYAKHFEPLCNLDVDESLPHHRILTKNLSLALINSHPMLHYPRAYLPNMVEIAGAHLNVASVVTLPNHLKEFMESAPAGVVYMSLGANARTMDLAREKLETIIDVFAFLGQFHFLLKWETAEFNMDLPSNVMINSWFPQEAILAHPHVKVFISSCGLLSVLESVAGLTPILAIPIQPEQELVARRLQNNGAALMLPFDALAYDAMLYSIEQLANNVSYQHQMSQLNQRLFHSQQNTPISQALHYIDLILQTRGADYLKSHANHLNFWRSELLDVIGIIALGLCGILAVPFLVICCILRKSYYMQAAASVNQTSSSSATTPTTPSAYHVTLKAMGRTQSFADESRNVQDILLTEPTKLRRRSTSHSMSTTSSSSDSSSPSSESTQDSLLPLLITKSCDIETCENIVHI